MRKKVKSSGTDPVFRRPGHGMVLGSIPAGWKPNQTVFSQGILRGGSVFTVNTVNKTILIHFLEDKEKDADPETN